MKLTKTFYEKIGHGFDSWFLADCRGNYLESGLCFACSDGHTRWII